MESPKKLLEIDLELFNHVHNQVSQHFGAICFEEPVQRSSDPISVASIRNLNDRMQTYIEEYQRLTARLSETGFIWPGHIQRRYLTCGKPNCVCHKHPEARHGPYAYWTSKKNKKTVSRLLRPEEADLLEEWIKNRRKLEAVVHQMKGLSQKAANVALKLQEQKKPG